MTPSAVRAQSAGAHRIGARHRTGVDFRHTHVKRLRDKNNRCWVDRVGAGGRADLLQVSKAAADGFELELLVGAEVRHKHGAHAFDGACGDMQRAL